jgi:hypothetical protein
MKQSKSTQTHVTFFLCMFTACTFISKTMLQTGGGGGMEKLGEAGTPAWLERVAVGDPVRTGSCASTRALLLGSRAAEGEGGSGVAGGGGRASTTAGAESSVAPGGGARDGLLPGARLTLWPLFFLILCTCVLQASHRGAMLAADPPSTCGAQSKHSQSKGFSSSQLKQALRSLGNASTTC